MSHCGSCTACCRIFAIPEIDNKPAGQWCQHCAVGVGCRVYQQRPKVCVDFKCLWLLSREREDPGEHFPEMLRPDQCKVVFSASTNENIMAATTMPGSPDAWQRKPVRKLIGTLVRAGYRVVVGQPASTDRIMFDHRGQRDVKMTPPDQDGMQYNIPTKGADDDR